jgi:hypothetical protein
MKRRHFLGQASLAALSPWGWASAQPSIAQQTGEEPKIQLPALPDSTPLPEVVLFGFDDRAFPFQNHLQTQLIPARNPSLVLDHGPEGSHDEVLLYYGTVVRIGETFHMWYNGNHGPRQNDVNIERTHCKICYAKSKDGVHWEKPELGLVEFNGSKKNNIVDLTVPNLWSTCALLYDPADRDSSQRFKMAYEARYSGQLRFCVAFSPDGFRWKPFEGNPVGPFLEMAGITKHNDLYYVNGQSLRTAPSMLDVWSLMHQRTFNSGRPVERSAWIALPMSLDPLRATMPTSTKKCILAPPCGIVEM